MAGRVPSKHGRDHAQDVEGLLNNLQDWELSFKDKEKKLKPQPQDKGKYLPAQRRNVGNGFQPSNSSKIGQMPAAQKPHSVSSSGKHDYLKDYDELSKLSSSILATESSVDANSEKELGNDFFKKKNYNEAIDCYSRSIALSPTAVAYANRAMAYIKLRRFQEAESDCSEALNLDDQYTKAYSRRSTARKELGKLKESLEDVDFALKLEPQSQELKKQYTEVKTLLEKDVVNKLSKASCSSLQGSRKKAKASIEVDDSVNTVQSRTSTSDGKMIVEMQDNQQKTTHGESALEVHGESSHWNAAKGKKKLGKQALMPSVQELSTRVASLYKAQAAKNISPPNTARQFETSWQDLSGDHNLQACLLKTILPTSLPHLFKSALSAPILMDIIRCIATFFIEDMDSAVQYLQNVTKTPRFDVIVMCLPSTDKSVLAKLWNEVFSKATPEYDEILGQLRARYRVPEQK
ncbi:OLC1v1002031C1 [Oldenlandia corymbosa var. corymbosa]|uniref:OLC1v1002031C1 n=1 Tax=Oldenlandia corymbosa var. corymbosa TaxID=529605 RepID=A0AAV1D7V4_OLDCO|nr:OLC1v1002031C1 [Oldenlandia corymbosa var. corymbosa]